jgi:hypothetical protein
MGEWPFVPEGQADSSQARRCLGSDASPRPGGTVEVIVSPRDICRRDGVHVASETLGFLLKGMLACNLSRDPFNLPAGTGYFPPDS